METEQLRNIDINGYWPSVVGQTDEFKQIAEAENPEFNSANEALYRLLKDNFILEATEYGVKRWETILGLPVNSEMSLDDRKSEIIAYLSVKIPYTWKVLKQMLVSVLGDGAFKMTMDNDTQVATITYSMAVSEIPQGTVDELVKRVIPANLIIDYDYDVPAIVKLFEGRLTELLGESGFEFNFDGNQNITITYSMAVSEIPSLEGLISSVLPENVTVNYDYDVPAIMNVFKNRVIELLGDDVTLSIDNDTQKIDIAYTSNVTDEERTRVEELTWEVLPTDVVVEHEPFPTDYTRVEFLESTGTQYIDTGVVPTNETGLYMEAEITGTSSDPHGAGIKETSGSILAPVQRAVRSDGFSWGTWISVYNVGINNFNSRYKGWLNFLNDRKGVLNSEKVNFERKLSQLSFVPTLSAFLFGSNYNGAFSTPYTGRIYSFDMSEGEAIIVSFIPALDPTGTPCMYDTVTKKPFPNNGTGQFIAGFTMKQALKLENLPETGGSMTISLPKEARLVQENGVVEVALGAAREKGWNISVQYREAGEEAVYNKYAECTTDTEVVAVNADYKKDLTDEGEWIYPLPEMTVFPSPNLSRGFFYGSNIKKIKGVFPKCTSSTALLGEMKKIEEVDVEFPIATYVTNTCLWSTTLKKVRIVAPKVRYFYGNAYVGSPKFVDCEFHAPVAENIQDLCRGARYLEEAKGEFGANVAVGSRAFYDCEKLRVLPTNYPKMQVAENMFYGCQLSAETAIAILDSFPNLTSGSHLVTVGIHVDYQNDESVAEAVANAESKGWTVTLQWNGTATAQASATYGLRRQPIYAKRGTMELPDGTIENILDWGHYVTNWEEHGYQEFASVEEAEEYFNIKKEITE